MKYIFVAFIYKEQDKNPSKDKRVRRDYRVQSCTTRVMILNYQWTDDELSLDTLVFKYVHIWCNNLPRLALWFSGRGFLAVLCSSAGVSARSRSAPGRSPPQSPPVRRQPPMPGLSRHVQRWHQQHGHELRPRQPEDEVGCAGLLCCRLLDFY